MAVVIVGGEKGKVHVPFVLQRFNEKLYFVVQFSKLEKFTIADFHFVTILCCVKIFLFNVIATTTLLVKSFPFYDFEFINAHVFTDSLCRKIPKEIDYMRKLPDIMVILTKLNLQSQSRND